MTVTTPVSWRVTSRALPPELGIIRLNQALAFGRQLVDAVEAFAVQFALADLGDIDLPPLLQPKTDQAHLQVVAPLYLAAELEAAQLLPAVEMLAGIFVSGGIQADLGDAAPLIIKFWKGRQQRFNAAERQAFFTRLFGAQTPAGPVLTLALADGENRAFAPLFIDLCEALYKLEPTPMLGAPIVNQIPLQMAARRLAANLIPRSGGMATFAARDLLHANEEALAILKQPLVQQALGGHSVWMALHNIVLRYLHHEIDVASHVVRAQVGMQVLVWLAAILPQLDDDAAPFVSPNHPVIAAAAAWLQASLTLEEAQVAPVGQRG